MAYQAIALKKPGRNGEAAELLGQAETLLEEPLKSAKLGGGLWEACRIALEQARKVIGPSADR